MSGPDAMRERAMLNSDTLGFSENTEVRFSDVTIIIPAFNEENTIGRVLHDLRERFVDAKILVVDDGSHDRTRIIAREANAKVFRHERNLGYGASLKTGLRNTTGPYVVFFDADGQHGPDDIPRLSDVSVYGTDLVVVQESVFVHPS